MKKTRNFKKLMSSVLALVMVLSTMMLVPLTIGAEGLQGDGTEVTPYLVGSKADLEAVAAATAEATETTVYVKLTADVTLDAAVALNGAIAWNIDGENFKLTTVAPLFATASALTVADLNVVTAQTAAEGDAAGFVGTLTGPATFTNCTVSGTITATAGIAGGFIAVMDAGTDTALQSPNSPEAPGADYTVDVTFTNCENAADITAATYAGGFVAKLASGDPLVNGGINTGDVTTTCDVDAQDKVSSAAGFIGWQIDKKTVMTTIKNAINLGTITPANGVGAAFAGHVKSSYVTLENCYDNGLVVRPLFGTDNAETVVATNTATLAEVMAMIAQPKTPVSKLNATAWDGITTTEPALQNPDAPNSAENPYLIGTADELAYLNGNALGYCKLTDNIDMGGLAWTGVTAGNHIDGDNYTIYNIFANGYSAGFLKAGTLNANISNLHFSAMKVAGGSGAGGFAAYAQGSAVLNISNVTIDANSIIGTDRTAGNTTAGIVGDEYGGNSPKITVDKFIMAAQITNTSSSKTQIGGLFGGFEAANNAGNIVVTNTIVEGTVVAVDSGAYVGSLVGEGGAAYAWTNVYVLAGVTAAGVSSKALSPAISNCYSASFAASENFADEIGEINKMGLTDVEVTSTVGGKRATRLKVTDDFGFMALADKSDDSFNPHATVGIVVLKGAVDAETLMAEGTFVEAEDYQAASGQICAKYTDISVATMDEDYTYAFAVAANGTVVSVGTLYTINCYDWASQLAVDGTYEGTAVTNVETEIALYDAMVKYCDKYNDYLSYVNAQ